MDDPPLPEAPRPLSGRLAEWRALLPQPTAARVAVAIVIAVGVVVAAVLLTRKPAAPPLVLPRAAPETSTTAAAAAAGGGGAAATITVHAAGAVVRPGIYALSNAARVADVLAAAGGAAPEADLDQVNLAAKVSDAERVYLPKKGEPAPAPAAGGAAASGGTPAAPLDLNAATAEQLETLPGVGPATAQAVLQFRASNGRFRAVDDLLEVRGIGPAKLEALRPLVRVS